MDEAQQNDDARRKNGQAAPQAATTGPSAAEGAGSPDAGNGAASGGTAAGDDEPTVVAAGTGQLPAVGRASGDHRLNGAVHPGRHSGLVAPVGFPLARGDVLSSTRCVFNELRGRRRARRALADYLGVRRVWLMGSGRSGLAVVLEALASSHTERNEVVIPAYTCYSVPSAIVRAGLKVRLVDLAPGRLDIDEESLAAMIGPRTLAVIVPHLLGVPMDVHPIMELAEKHGACVIDDGAQALGARRRGRSCGASGHIGILSFGRGKPLTTLGGGAVACDDGNWIPLLEPALSAVNRPGRFASISTAVQASIYSLMLRPDVYWLPSRLPFLKVGQTEFDPDFAITSMPAFKLGLLLRGLMRLDVVNEARRRVAEQLATQLAAIDVHGPALPEQGYSTFLRFPLVLDDEGVRDRVAQALLRAGISAGPLYPLALNRLHALASSCPEYGASFPNAERLAAGLLTVPTFPFVSRRVIERMTGAIAEALATAAPVADDTVVLTPSAGEV